MCSNYALPFGIALSIIIAAGPAGADPTDQKTPLVHLENQNQAERDPSASDEPAGTLVLPQALALALTQNPELATFSWETRAREAAALQASFFPNPTFGANAANFGNRSIQGFDGDVVTLELSQLIELGGKRAARTEAAALTKELADWDYESKRIDVLTQVSQAFIEVLAAQQRLSLTQQIQELANQMLVMTSARVQAGKVSPVEETKAKTARASVQIELMRAQRELEAARKRLAASWGSAAPRFEAVAGDLNAIRPPPSLESLLQRLANNPDLARWATEITQRQEVLPGAQSAYAAAREGYRLGKFGFLDVLDAQRTLFGAKTQYLLAQADYHKAVAEVERLIGGGLDDGALASLKQEASQ